MRKAYSLLEGDVIERLTALPDNHFDLIITSPPYNIGKIYERSNKLDLDDYISWLDKVTTTNINGLIICLRKLIEADRTHDVEYYCGRFGDKLATFRFGTYKSSQYVRMGQDLFEKFFAST